MVADGQRNRWLTSVALAYKWAGISHEEALTKIEQRLCKVSGWQMSRNCRSVRNIVKCIYRRLPETLGMFSHRDLPDWMTSDVGYERNPDGTSHRRGVAPYAIALSQGRGDLRLVEGLSAPKLLKESLPQQKDVDKGRFPQNGFDLRVKSLGVRDELENPFQLKDSSCVVQKSLCKKLVAIRRRQRVGVFDGENLVLCVTRRHYQASRALKLLADRPTFQGVELSIYSPHSAHQTRYFAAIDACDVVLRSSLVFGSKRTFADKMSQWRRSSQDELGCQGDDLAQVSHDSVSIVPF